MTINGTITHLRTGDYEATIGAVGASLLSLTHRGRHLVQPFDEDSRAEGYQGRTLVPWPNRVVRGRYQVSGTAYQLPVNELETGAALHGLAVFHRWDIAAITADRGRWVLELPASYGYPFEVECRVDYALDPGLGLSVTIAGTNKGQHAAPFGASTHPYLSCDAQPLSGCTLHLPAPRVLLTDEDLSPTSIAPVTGTRRDFTTPTLIGERLVDNAYTDLPEGDWVVELTHPDAVGVRMTSDARWVQLYTGDRIGRLGAAVEPMTCPPDAFNRQPDDVLLAPGATRQLWMRIGAIG
ncbi:MAG: aldose-1-epimerase [Actinomycetota bacterium]|nr:aldose-1-epimerase [Actinomycetota bacterium]